jgi:hypothetical protein
MPSIKNLIIGLSQVMEPISNWADFRNDTKSKWTGEKIPFDPIPDQLGYTICATP